VSFGENILFIQADTEQMDVRSKYLLS